MQVEELKGLILALANKNSQSLQTFWLQYHNLIGSTRFFVKAHRLGVSSQGPALPDVPATVVHQVEHLSPLQVWLFHSGFVRLLIAGSPIPHLHLHPRRVTLKLLPFLPLLTADIPARKTIQYFLFPSPTLLPDRPPPKWARCLGLVLLKSNYPHLSLSDKSSNPPDRMRLSEEDVMGSSAGCLNLNLEYTESYSLFKRNISPKNQSSVITYSPSCCSSYVEQKFSKLFFSV